MCRSLATILHAILCLIGGYPEVQLRASAGRRQTWIEDYIELILDRDVRDIANIDQLDQAAAAWSMSSLNMLDS